MQEDRQKQRFTYQAIGTIYSPHKTVSGMPIQPRAAQGVRGRVEIDPIYQRGLKDLEGFSHLILIYHFDRVKECKLRVVPFLDDQERGVFSTRAPTRPNPLGLSVVRLVQVKGNILEIENVDILDQTPLIDLKPYVPDFDHADDASTGWIGTAGDEIESKRSDDRFA